METDTIKQYFDALPGSFFLTDNRATILYANRAVEDHTGFSAAEAIGKGPSMLWGGHMDGSFYSAMWKTLQKKEAFVGDVYNRKKNGMKETQRIHLAPIVDAGGRTRYYLALNPDFDSAVEQDLFGKEFVRAATSHRQKNDYFLEWIVETFDTETSTPSLGGSLYEFFYDVLVVPTEERYKDREADKALILSAKEHPEAFRALYEKYKDQIFDYFSHRVNDHHTAHDLTHDTFLRALKHLDRFVPTNASYATYLIKIAHNLLVNHYRAITPSPLEHIVELADDREVDIDLLLAKEKLWEAAESLSAVEQDMLAMKYKEAMSVREIALILQKTENAVKLQLSRARKKLRAELR
jgi:RNA polymerase sigma-70 factor (ECF subfamily)